MSEPVITDRREEALRILRGRMTIAREMGVKYTDMAAAIGRAPKTVRKWHSGKSVPKITVIRRLSEALTNMCADAVEDPDATDATDYAPGMLEQERPTTAPWEEPEEPEPTLPKPTLKQPSPDAKGIPVVVELTVRQRDIFRKACDELHLEMSDFLVQSALTVIRLHVQNR